MSLLPRLALVGVIAFAIVPGCSCEESSLAKCGDGVVDPGEQCDDGNVADGDGCSSFCRAEQGKCGDGVKDEGEECDDGNTKSGDGCSSSCKDEAKPGECGDGVKDAGEECDDGNDTAYDGCEEDCTVSPDEVECQKLTPIQGAVCEVTAGDGRRLLVGDVLLEHTVLKGGQVLVDAAGKIACAACDCGDAAAGATEVVCPRGVITPGLVNSHDHITYAHNDPIPTDERYEHRHEWRKGINGHTKISYKSGASKDQVRWGELRFVLGGATSTVGSGSATGFLRNLDTSDQEGLGQKQVHYETFPLGDSGGDQLVGSCAYPGIDTKQSIAGDDAYYPHIAEGIDAAARNEFLCVSGLAEDLLEPQSAFIHSVGLTPIDYAQMQVEGTTLVWSPRSNISLYGETAVVTTAARLGVRIVLGTDWMPSGSMNVLRELACADGLNQDYYDGFFSDRDLWHMVTGAAAEAAGMDDAIGRLRPGLVADIAIFDGSGASNAHRAIVAGEPKHVSLVLRGGQVLFGDDALVEAIGPGGCDALDVCGSGKRVCASSDIGKSLDALEGSVGSIYPLFFCGVPDKEPTCTPSRPKSVNGSTTYTGAASAEDGDGDGVPDKTDNCPTVFNPVRPLDDGQQADFDGDGDGDACDVCPINPDVTDCAGFDPNDLDGDGLLNAEDNCPMAANKDQADGDGDGKGDECDPCPDESNPGELGCLVSIYDIKTGKATGVVGLKNVLVTGCAPANGFFLQAKQGDPDYQGAEDSGVFVYHPAVQCGSELSVGDRVTLNPTKIGEFYGQIQLTGSTIMIESSQGEASPDPVPLTSAAAGGNQPNAYESVIIEVKGAVVTDDMPAPGTGDKDAGDEVEVDGVLRVDGLMHVITPKPTKGQVFTTLRGILTHRNSLNKLEPRAAADVASGPPVLAGFGPTPTFARVGFAAEPTIPDPLTVTLSGPAESNTVVTIGSSDEASLVVVTGGVTIPKGQQSITVPVDGLGQSAKVTLTASLDGKMLSADVRVLGAGEKPKVAGLSPAMGSVAVMGKLGMQVLLDIPAATPGGTTVALSTAPGTFGSVPPSVLVAADKLSATFDFTATATTGSETVTATLDASMAQASVDVVQGGGLVINEVDYDQIMDDTDEYVELYNASGAPISLAGLSLVLVNGGDKKQYLSVDLGPAGSLGPGEYLVVGSATLVAKVMNAKTITFAKAKDNVQNGAPDAVGILDTVAQKMLDVLSYEGALTMGIVTGVNGTVDFVEGTETQVGDSNTQPGSLCRLPNGVDTDDASKDWAFCMTPTPGAANM